MPTLRKMANDKTQPAATKPAPKELGKPITLDRQAGVMRFTSDGRLLAVGTYDAGVRLFDASATTGELKELPVIRGHHHGFVDALATAKLGETSCLFTADTWGRLTCWDVTKELAQKWSREKAHDGWIRQLALGAGTSAAQSPGIAMPGLWAGGAKLASCGRDGIVRVWNAADGKLLHELKEHGEDVYAVAFHPDGTLISGDLKGVVRQWDLKAGKTFRQFDASVLHKLDRIQDVGGARVLTFSRDGAFLYVAGATPKTGGFVECSPRILRFDWKTGKQDLDMPLGEPKDGFVYELIEHADGYLIAVTSGQPGNGKLLLLKPGEKEPLFATTKMQNCHALALHPDGKRIAVAATVGGSNGNGRQLKDGKYPGNSSPIHVWTLA